jgi:hypothetical protein
LRPGFAGAAAAPAAAPFASAPEPALIPPPASAPRQSPPDASAPSAVKVRGTVVHVRPGAYVVATAAGELIPIPAERNPSLSDAVTTAIVPLANGTFEQQHATSGSRKAEGAKLQGTVTFVDPDAHVYTLSVRGASLLVHSGPDAPVPQPGLAVTVDAAFDESTAPDGTSVVQLRERTRQDGQAATGPVDHEGTVQAVDVQAQTVTLSADDAHEAGRDIVVAVPAGLDVSTLRQGDVIDATLTIATDGAYALTGWAHDEDGAAANDLSRAGGDQKPAGAARAAGRRRARAPLRRLTVRSARRPPRRTRHH